MAYDCDWSDLVWEIAWQRFIVALRQQIVERMAKGALKSASLAVLDGPIPGPGDVAAIANLLWEAIGSAWGTANAMSNLWSFYRTALQKVEVEIFELADGDFPGFPRNQKECDCLKAFIRGLLTSSAKLSTREKTARRNNLFKKLKDCVEKARK